MAKVGVVLSGCGVYDGAEIHESVLTLLSLDRRGAEVIFMAPDQPQMHVINHLTGNVDEGSSRNVLVESARIARGKIRDLATVKAGDLDALIFPGGFGAAKNLSSFAVRGADSDVHPEVMRLVQEMSRAKKPIGFVCIAPAIAAKIFGPSSVKVTIGTDEGTASALQKMGARHVACPVEKCVIDEEHHIVSTPAYMLAGHISEAADGIDALVEAVLKMV
ncbi:MAG TPA: isoprenoid biosynthesis glyoxalase ElbB [Thermoanaerobaculia bacterium]|nr:isoprenoid biosynthesis glyoxalase ElbB [Thermoanaerobaculia bacterium]HUM29910.1 isoprenoid biosynthesis glyoxalase ElbB [Thermoanaerobaculia bacterium]HXK68223.1 isoprenoid biosynthesis glyoxalase ElbB [Thermoanaerobaculia bacterium]